MQDVFAQPRPARVLVADHDTGRRDRLVQALSGSDAFDVICEAADGFEAVNAAKVEQPDVSLLALALPRLSGLEALRYVRAAVPGGVVMVASAPTVPAGAPTSDELVVDLRRLLHMGEPAHPSELGAIDLPASAVSAAAARQFVDRELRDRGFAPLAGIAALLASEIVTNAVVHAQSASRMSLTRAGDALRVEVTDWGDGAVELRQLVPMAIGGRGLHIVDAAADAWGTVAARDWKTVWFEIGGGRHDGCALDGDGREAAAARE